MATPEAPAVSGRADRNHGMRIFLIWLPLAVIADILIWFVWKPHMPPGTMTTSAEHQQFDIAFLAMVGAPVMLFVWTYAGYALFNWRHREGDEEDGPPIHGNARIQATWIGATAVIVLGLFVFGTVELIVPAGAGAGEGPAPIWQPSTSNRLQVQVIGQQWAFTYRFPQFGGMESSQLVLPANTTVEFHVTSLDVIHSFWAYQLGVKADANPGVDNVAFTTTKSQLGTFTVRCNELCGLWHGAMYNYGHIVTQAAFTSWARGMQLTQARNGILNALPPYSTTYDPTVIPQLGAAIVKIDGITGGAGYYYPPQDPVTP
jgi:cytochrome c oxidase subunit II